MAKYNIYEVEYGVLYKNGKPFRESTDLNWLLELKAHFEAEERNAKREIKIRPTKTLKGRKVNMKVEILKVENEYQAPTKEEFAVDPYYAPLITMYKMITFKFRDREFTTRVHLGSDRAKVYAKSLYKYMKANNLAEIRDSTLVSAYRAALSYCRKEEPYASKQRNEEMCSGVKLESNENKHEEALAKTIELIEGKDNMFFVKNLIEEPQKKATQFNTYLYFHIGTISFESENKEVRAEEKALEFMANCFLNNLSMKFEKFDLETIEGSMGMIEYLCDNFDYCSVESTRIVKEERLIQQAMDELIDEDTLIKFIKNNLAEAVIEEELEAYGNDTLEELLEDYLEEPFSE